MAAERGRKVEGTTRPGSRSVQMEKADEEVAQSTRELAVLEEELARVQHGPAAETPAAVATELARCMNKTLVDMKRFHNIPQDHVNEMETLMKTLVEGVARLATSFSQQAGDETEPEESKKQAVEAGAKAADTATTGSGRRRTSAHDGIDGIDGANRRVAGYGRCNGGEHCQPLCTARPARKTSLACTSQRIQDSKCGARAQ